MSGLATAGFDVERLTARMSRTPTAFRDKRVVPHAVVHDLFAARASRALSHDELSVLSLARSPEERRHFELVTIASWLLYDEAFSGTNADRLFALLTGRLGPLSARVVPRAFVDDPERREELVRVCLAELDLAIAGESREQSEDRLATLDSVHRHDLLARAKAREAERERERRARAEELERIRRQEEDERRQAARATFED
jgi:hypothetical protein